MTSRVAARLARLEHNTGAASPRVVVVGEKSLEAARAFLQGRPDVDMNRVVLVVTGVRNDDDGPEAWLRAARGEAPVSRYGGRSQPTAACGHTRIDAACLIPWRHGGDNFPLPPSW